MNYSRIVDTGIIVPLLEMYRNGYRKATNTSNGVSFQKEDKATIGEAVWNMMDGPNRLESTPDTGYISMQTVSQALASCLTNGEKAGTIMGRLNLWRAAHNRKMNPNEYTAGGFRKPVVDTASSPVHKPAVAPVKHTHVAGDFEREFDRKREAERMPAFLKFLREEADAARIRVYEIEEEIKRLTA